MISWYDGGIADILPGILKDDPAVQALSYAVRQGTRLLYRYCQRLFLYEDLTSQPEEIVDLLAAELRTQYYREDMDLDTKRQLVKNTIIWYMSAGTPEAVEELAEKVLGSGRVEEWWEYGGKPYCFKIATDADMDAAHMAEFYGMIARVKNARSHLDAVDFCRDLAQQLYFCGVCSAEGRAEIGYTAEALAYLSRNSLELYSCGACIVEGRAEIRQRADFSFEIKEDGHLWMQTDLGSTAAFRIREDGCLVLDIDAVQNADRFRIREDGHMVYEE